MINYTEELRKNVHALSKDARVLVADTGHLAGETVAAVRQHLSGALEGAQETCDRLQQKAVDRIKATGQVVYHHPYQTMGIAVGIGAILGFLLMRCKSGCLSAEERKKTTLV